MSSVINRVANWSVMPDGIVQFIYHCNDLPYRFFVTKYNMRKILKDIGNMAANPACDLDWHDAEYLTSLIREVMYGLSQPEVQRCDCDECRSHRIGEFIWMLAMGVCSAAFWVALLSFIIWGLR